MSKKTNPKLVGVFVIGAIVLVITGILAFGGLQYFSSKIKFVAFFPGASLSGLDVGSPVTFRGVKVGQITSIVIQYDVVRQRLRVPIRFDLDTNRLQFISGEQSPERNIPELIARGLRGQLQTVSLVTGQTTIDFNFYPDTPARLFGSAAGVGSGVIELPTIPSDIEQLKTNLTSVLAKLSKLPPEKISDEIITTIADADLLLRDGDSAVKRGGSLAANIDAQVVPLAKSIIGAADHATSFLSEAEARVRVAAGRAIASLESDAGRRPEADQRCRCQLAPDRHSGRSGAENGGRRFYTRRRPDEDGTSDVIASLASVFRGPCNPQRI